jgi:hypothetical protein
MATRQDKQYDCNICLTPPAFQNFFFVVNTFDAEKFILSTFVQLHFGLNNFVSFSIFSQIHVNVSERLSVISSPLLRLHLLPEFPCWGFPVFV